jgi:hypothetical protein
MKIKLLEIANVDEVIKIKTELISFGLTQGSDFSFSYHTAHWDNFTGCTDPSWLEIDFYDKKKSLRFLMKYSNRIKIIESLQEWQ